MCRAITAATISILTHNHTLLQTAEKDRSEPGRIPQIIIQCISF